MSHANETKTSSPPAEPPVPSAAENDRRTFFERLSIGLSVVIGAIMTLPPLSYVLAPIFAREDEVWEAVGAVEKFGIGKTILVRFTDASSRAWASITAKTGAWLRRVDNDDFIAFSINCRHLGCPVRWEEGPGLFMCPCHGGVYTSNGDVAAGPPPEPLHRYPVRVRNGQVEIRTSPIPLTTNDPV